LLYVALTRARRGFCVVGDVRRGRSASLLGLLAAARARDEAAFDALLPPEVVDVVSEHRLPPRQRAGHDAEAVGAAADEGARGDTTAATATSTGTPLVTAPSSSAIVARPPTASAVPRLQASTLLRRADPQLSIGLAAPDDPDLDADVLPPRARGRLAHAVIALVAAESPDALDTAEDARAAVLAAWDALGAPPLTRDGGIDGALVDALVRTLRGPVRALRDEGRVFSFEEPLVLVTDVAVVEGTADLVARGPEDALVVEWKLSSSAARGAAATVQAQVCCAALEQQGRDPALRFAVWAVGELHPPPSQPWGRVARRELATVLARLATAPGG
jgi:hypothetical protein